MQSQTNHVVEKPRSLGAPTPEARLISFLENTLESMGYELVSIEILNHREKTLRVFIDKIKSPGNDDGVGIEDCVRVTRELDEPLEANADVLAIFKGAYELEVSSPGIDRPLRKPGDYNKFAGEITRLSTFRPLTGDETKATEYSSKNPKQKKFYGIIRGFENESASILFGVIPDDGIRNKPKPETLIRIPLELVQKANLDPEVVYPEED